MPKLKQLDCRAAAWKRVCDCLPFRDGILIGTVKPCVYEPGFFNLALTGPYINGTNLDYQGS